MYKGMTAPVLEPVGEAKVVLQSVNVEAKIENLLCEVTIKQVYSNLEKINIEAVYTFPLPLSAVLLDMTIKTGTRELKGVVIEKTEAEDRYEDAITDGDTAIMLEQVDPGLYTMNVGNLQPEDTIEISITYAELFKWRDNSLRFFLPTTTAPRYGDPESVGIQPHQTPEYDLTADNPFAITISVFGELADASFKSPSHRLDVERQDGKTAISLKNGEALMDRDFVLNISMETEEKSFAILDKDFDGHIALASFYPKFPDVSVKAPRCIIIIIDCSGSMSGDSIAQARKALRKIIDDLRPQDNFNVIRFGNNFKKLFTSPMQALSGNLKKAMNLLENLNADMGGTEIGGAITAAIDSKIPEGLSREIFLITDGEVWDWEKVATMAAKSDFRFFTVGVGSSVSEAFVQTLADDTGGACELVSPHEDMAEKIVRHFKRIYFPRAEDVKISWSCEPDKVFPVQVGNIYDGDTLHVFGRFQKKPDGDVTLTAKLENGETFTQRLSIGETSFSETMVDLPGTTARMAAACDLRSLSNSKEIAALGVKYQLMTQHTNYLAIDVKAEDEKAGDLPALRKTPQMLAAGWGGLGTVVESPKASLDYMPSVENLREPSPYSVDKKNELERPDYGRDKLIKYVESISQRKREEYTKFQKYNNRKRNKEQKAFFSEMLRIESYLPESFYEELSEQNIQKMVDHIKNSLLSEMKDYIEFISELFHEEISEHKRYVEWFIHEEIDRINDLINEFLSQKNQLNILDTKKFFKELENYFGISERLIPLPTIKRLSSLGLPDEIVFFLSNLINDIHTEEDVVSTFLYALLRKPFDAFLQRQLRRKIHKSYKKSPQNQELYKKIFNKTENLS